ncbi:MAG TPA: glycosyltransferase [Elusimicrobiota bacterium]|nr:glycosyltransferase [Elusimicrobiota bacterium]
MDSQGKDSFWREHCDAITDRVPAFYALPFARRLFHAVVNARRYDACVLYFDPRFALALSVILRILSPRTRTVLVEVYPTVGSINGLGSALKWLSYHLLFKSLSGVIVHSRYQANLYAGHFKVSRSKFKSVNYFTYHEGPSPMSSAEQEARWRQGNILCVGRHRDIRTFIEAVDGIGRRAQIVTGAEGSAFKRRVEVSANIELFVEVPKEKYYAAYEQAAVIVIPFSEAVRSFGHMAYLEGAWRKIPMISSRTEHLADYAEEEKDIILYAAGDSKDLRKQITRVLADKELATSIGSNACLKASAFTRQRYVRSAYAAIEEVVS